MVGVYGTKLAHQRHGVEGVPLLNVLAVLELCDVDTGELNALATGWKPLKLIGEGASSRESCHYLVAIRDLVVNLKSGMAALNILIASA